MNKYTSSRIKVGRQLRILHPLSSSDFCLAAPALFCLMINRSEAVNFGLCIMMGCRSHTSARQTITIEWNDNNST